MPITTDNSKLLIDPRSSRRFSNKQESPKIGTPLETYKT